jgi:hypothetical protein
MRGARGSASAVVLLLASTLAPLAGCGRGDAQATTIAAAQVAAPMAQRSQLTHDVPRDRVGAATLAELPRVTLTTTYPTGGRNVRVRSGGDLQAALNAAKPGDVLLLPPGSVWTGNFTLPRKSGQSWIVLRTDVQLPPEGTRITPSLAKSLRLAKLVTPTNEPVLATALGAHHVRLAGLEITASGGRDVYNLVSLGDGSSRQNTVEEVAHDLVLDRSYVHGLPTLNLRRCVALNSATTAIVDSWLGECHSNQGDSQAIGGWNGPGPYAIENNTLESGHQAFMFGGSDPAIRDLIPSDITIRGNHMTRPVEWKGSYPYRPGKWQTKTIAETKNAQRVLVDGNVIENVWADAQVGYAILFKSSNQDGGCRWCTTSDVTFRYNRIRNVAAVYNLAARPEMHPAVPAARFTIHDNLTDAVNVGAFRGPGVALQVLGDVADIVFVHNTTINPTGNSATMFDGSPNTRFVMHSNLFSNGQYGVFGSGKGVGIPALQFYAPKALFERNVIVGADCGVYPPTTSCPAKLTDVGFVKVLAGDYRMAAGSGYRGRGHDGRDIGADVDRVEQATRRVVVEP